ncbi:MFS transporter [bacterium]|nr:MFS transporter [bacterium]
MVERLAFYGVRSLAGIYGKSPVSEGGLGVSIATWSLVMTSWNFTQSVVPIFLGGIADRYGYKQAIALSTAIKISGYVCMATFLSLPGFWVGATLLAIGTAVFKPGIQGTLVKCTNRRNSSLAWGIFYQTVNIGAFIGPIMSGYLRQFSWRGVFIACAATICLNFLLLLTYKEPGIEERLERQRKFDASGEKRRSLFVLTVIEIIKPHVALFLLIYVGYYFLFYAFMDVLPVYLDDWVHTGSVLRDFFGDNGIQSPLLRRLLVTNAAGTEIQPEGLANLNAAMIMTTCFLFGYLSSRLKALHSMLVGISLVMVGYVFLGNSGAPLVGAFAIIVFSMGEMLSSPKFGEFVGNIAPDDKKAMYLGFSQISVALGATLQSFIGLRVYSKIASKDQFARDMLVNQYHYTAEAIRQIPNGDAFKKLVEVTGQSPEKLTNLLFTTHGAGRIWYMFVAVGVVTATCLYLYSVWIERRKARKAM